MPNSNEPQYPSKQGKVHIIDKMSIGYLKNQIEFISHTGIKEEYLSDLQKAYKQKTKIIFKPLLDEHE